MGVTVMWPGHMGDHVGALRDHAAGGACASKLETLLRQCGRRAVCLSGIVDFFTM